MKRIIALLLIPLIAISTYAQITGGFNCKDKDAWFDKEIYFTAVNKAINYYGYGVNIYNPVFVVNGEFSYTLSVWQYGTSIYIDDVPMKKGTTVSLYIGNKLYNSWECLESQPSTVQTAIKGYSTIRLLKKAARILKKIK